MGGEAVASRNRGRWRFLSNTGRVSRPIIENLVGHIEVDVERLEGPCEGMLNLEFVDTLEMMCERQGLVSDVSEEMFEFFVTMDEDSMRAVLRALYFSFGRWINRICDDMSLDDREADMLLMQLIDLLLYLVARGNIRFDPKGQATFFKAKGPRPSPEVQRRILDRISSERQLQRDVALTCTRDYVLKSRQRG